MKNGKKIMLLAVLTAVMMPAAAKAQTYGYPIPLRGSVQVSSELDTDRYSRKLIADLNSATTWTEGVDGLGIGETITWTYKEEKWIYGMAILPGYQKSANVYKWNAVPTRLLIQAGSKTMRCSLDEYEPDFSNPTESMRYVDFPEPVLADKVVVTIEKAQEGTKYEDTCISELFFYEYATSQSGAAKAKPSVVCDPDKEPAYSGKSSVTPTKAAEKTGKFIFEDSDSRYLSADEVAALSDDELRIARNEIYARRGYIFGNKEMKTYFEAQDWYKGTVSPADFDMRKFNTYEWENLDRIVKEEESRQVDSSTTLLLQGNVFDEEINGDGDIENCLSPKRFTEVTSEDGSFSFAYPTTLFNGAEYFEDTYQYSYFDDSDDLKYALYVYKYSDEGNPLSRVKALYNERLEDFDSTYMTHQSSSVDSKGFAHALIGGYTDEEMSEEVYLILANDGDCSYVLEFCYATDDFEIDSEPVNYVIDTLYRYCSFSGSTYRPRTYEQYLNNEAGTKK